MSELIFSADDFGKSEQVNRNILKLAKSGKIQRVSVFSNRKPIDKNAIKAIFDSRVKIDLHLDSRLRENDNFSTFYRVAHFFYSFLVGKISVSAVKTDWENQIISFIKLFGRVPDGLNSHEHVHFFPPYLKIALKLCKKYEIKYIRFGKKGIIPGQSPVAWILGPLNRLGRQKISTANINTSDYLVSFDWKKNQLDSYSGSIEIVCHPEREKERLLLEGAVFPYPAEKSQFNQFANNKVSGHQS